MLQELEGVTWLLWENLYLLDQELRDGWIPGSGLLGNGKRNRLKERSCIKSKWKGTQDWLVSVVTVMGIL